MMYNSNDSFISQYGGTFDKSDIFSFDSENSISDSNNFLFDPLQLNLDESKSQENYIIQSDFKIEGNESNCKSFSENNSFWDLLNIGIQSHLFYPTDNSNKKEDNILFYVKKNTSLKGRKRKKERNNTRQHDKYSDDNINRKIQVHSINFIINFINLILIRSGKNEQLCDISSLSKQNENKTKFSLLKNMTIEQILSQEISPKYTTIKNKRINVILMEKIKDNPKILNFLSANFLTVFRELYINEKGIKLNLPNKIKTYKDLVNKYKNEPLYVKKLNQCLHKYFLC